MRFDRVGAPAFGPLKDDLLELASGMNVIYGPNEAGKSSWHAALYAGLCGMRRGRGQPRKEEAAFAERHKPWVGDRWESGVVVTRANGQQIEFRQNLAGRNGRARDTSIAGVDYTQGTLNDGMPDGSIWLGLNRQTYLSTACIQQADVLGILDDPAKLQDDMQRAAASAARNATAAAALDRLREYRREYVGSTQAPSRPLRVTRAAARNAEIALSNARDQHAEFLRRQLDVDALEDAAREMQGRVNAMRAALAEREAERSAEHLRQIRRINAEFPDGPPHASPEDEALVGQVATALHLWALRPEPVAPDGLTVEELAERIYRQECRLAATRAAVAERDSVGAKSRLERARALSAHFPDGQAPRTSPAEEAQAERVRRALASAESLNAPEALSGDSAEQIKAELAKFDADVEESAPQGPSLRGLLRVVACLFLAGGVALALIEPGMVVVGLTLAGTGAAGGIATLKLKPGSRRRDEVLLESSRRNIVQGLELRREREQRYEQALRQYEENCRQVLSAAQEIDPSTIDLSAAVRVLRDWLDVRQADAQRRAALGEQWDELQQLLGGETLADIEAEANQTEERAASLIAAADGALLVDARMERPTYDDLTRAEQETNAQIRAWERERSQRRVADDEYASAQTRLAGAQQGLRQACAAIGADASEPDAMQAALEHWQRRRESATAEAQARNERWDELQGLLAGQTVDDVAEVAKRLQANANAGAAHVPADALAIARRSPSQEALVALESELQAAREERERATGELAEFGRDIPSVPDAEESLAAAERERDRVAALDATLDRTIQFLADAQDRVHRNIAPILRDTVLDWLPDVTAGRYVDCKVNPRTLQVEVASPGGDWRDAGLLSRGTAEHVYLLLRLALTRHLTSDEPCPLILDDALAAADAQRKRAALDTLLAISQDTQVILFTHEDDVRQWARERLTEPHHRLQELPAPAIT